MAVTTQPNAPQTITFVIHHEGFLWWASSDDLGRYSAGAATRDALLATCREGVEFVTGRPASEFTLQFLDDYGRQIDG